MEGGHPTVELALLRYYWLRDAKLIFVLRTFADTCHASEFVCC